MRSAHAAISYVQITGDADSGISTDNNYTHAIDFAQDAPGTATRVNGQVFDFYNKSSGTTLDFSYVGGGNEDNNGTANARNSLTGSNRDLLQGFVHQNGSNAGNGSSQTLTLSGLIAGIEYDLRNNAVQWRPGTDRSSIFNFDPDGAGGISESSVSIDEDNPTTIGLSGADAFYINYRYTAVASED